MTAVARTPPPDRSIQTIKDVAAIEPHRRADIVIGEIGMATRQWQRSNRRPSTLSARDALIALSFEATVVAVASSNLAQGIVLGEADHQRLWLAHQRITTIADEVVGR